MSERYEDKSEAFRRRCEADREWAAEVLRKEQESLRYGKVIFDLQAGRIVRRHLHETEPNPNS